MNLQQQPLPELPSIMEHINKSMMQKQDELYLAIMRQFLKREPVIPDDVKDFEIVTHLEHPGRTFFGHKSVGLIGEIKMTLPVFNEDKNTYSMGWEFEPKNVID
jgi:hypothetical protein